MHQLSSSRRIALTDLPLSVKGSGVESFRFGSCCANWRECQPGDLFVAVTTADADGHDEVDRAVARGAIGVLAERLVPASVPAFVVEDTREAYGHICHLLADRPSAAMHTIGVAGSSGKTSIIRLIEAMLRSAGRLTAVASDDQWFMPAGGLFDELEEPTRPTQPTPPNIVSGLSDAAACGFAHAVVELSALDLARRTWAGTELDVVILTGMTDDFRGRHNSTANYRKAIRRALKLLSPTGMVIANADDPQVRELLAELDFPALTYSLRQTASIEAEVIEETFYEQTLAVHAGCDSIPIRLSRPGRHVASNALAAITLGVSLGLELHDVVRGIEQSEPAEGVLERVSFPGEDPLVMVDRAILPDRLRATLSTLRRTISGQIWCVCEVSHQLAAEHRPQIGALLERYVHHAALSVSPELMHRALPVLHDVLDGYETVGRDLIAPDTQKAIEWVLDRARPGDAVIVLGDVERVRESIAEMLEQRREEFESTSPSTLKFTPRTSKVSHEVSGPRILRIEDHRRRA